MGILDFDVGKIANNDAFMLGMGILGNNTGHYGQGGPAYAGGLQDYNRQKSLQAQQAKANQQAVWQQEQAKLQQERWKQEQEQYTQKQAQYQKAQERQATEQQAMQSQYPNIANLPQFAQQAYVKNKYKPPTAFDQKLNLYKKNPETYKTMYPGQKTTNNINMPGGKARIVSDAEKNQLGLDPDIKYTWDKQGQPKAVKISNFSDAQTQAGSFAQTMEEAEARMSGLMDLGYDPASMKQMISSDGGMLGNYASSGDSQVYTQAKENWVRAKLRKESGAVIGADEMADEVRVYFPQPGDKPAVIRAKAKSRNAALRGMAKMSGGVYSYNEPEQKAEPKSQQSENFEEKKEYNGKSYFKMNGKWYSE